MARRITSWFIGGPRDGKAYSDIPPAPPTPGRPGGTPRLHVEVVIEPYTPRLADFDNPEVYQPVISRRGLYRLIAWDAPEAVAVYYYEHEESSNAA